MRVRLDGAEEVGHKRMIHHAQNALLRQHAHHLASQRVNMGTGSELRYSHLLQYQTAVKLLKQDPSKVAGV